MDVRTHILVELRLVRPLGGAEDHYRLRGTVYYMVITQTPTAGAWGVVA